MRDYGGCVGFGWNEVCKRASLFGKVLGIIESVHVMMTA